MTPSQGRGTRPRLSRQRVLDAALALADARGIDALSMRSLGAELGVEAMSLYHHVSNKDDLLAALVDRVFAEVELPADDDGWKEAMRRRAAPCGRRWRATRGRWA
jgi:AcrR family transcriptional regulator